MPFFSPKKGAQSGKAGVFSIRTPADARRWLANRNKAFGCSTKTEVLQKWSARISGLQAKGGLKDDVRASGAGPVKYGGPDNKKITEVNPILVNALAKAMQIDPQDQRLSPEEVKELWPASMILADFCQCLQLLVAGTKFNMGPLKGTERMAEKLGTEYDYDLASLNDAYRASIVCKDSSCYDQLLSHTRVYVTPYFGISYHKEPKDKFADPGYLGYGDYTYYLNFREVDQTVELQIHQLGVIFGKTPEKSWEYADIATYSSLEGLYGIPGGLGHKFYVALRTPTTTEQQKEEFKKLSIKYYGICRGNKATPDDTKLFREIAKKLPH